jgi:hypothetical protein
MASGGPPPGRARKKKRFFPKTAALASGRAGAVSLGYAGRRANMARPSMKMANSTDPASIMASPALRGFVRSIVRLEPVQN